MYYFSELGSVSKALPDYCALHDIALQISPSMMINLQIVKYLQGRPKRTILHSLLTSLCRRYVVIPFHVLI